MANIDIVVQDPYVSTLRKSKLSFLKLKLHKHKYEILSQSHAKLRAKIPNSAMRVTEVSWSIMECRCGHMIEELRQEVVYGEHDGGGQ